jgi:hypothetical protein
MTLGPWFIVAAWFGLASAAAQEAKPLGTFERWGAFSTQERGRLVCYVATQPTDSKGNYSRRGEVFLLVTHRPAERANDVVSIVAGYDFRNGSEVEIAIGRDTYRLFTDGDRAWAADERTDKTLVQAMIRGQDLVAKGVSSRGTETTDTFSLVGFGRAYQAIGQACGVR